MKISGAVYVIGAAITAALLMSSAAMAQTPSSSLVADCTKDPGCETLKDQAADRSKSGDLPEALRLYKLAYEVRPDPRLLFNIARLHHKLGQRTEAASSYQRFLDAPIADDDQRQKAKLYLAQLRGSSVGVGAISPAFNSPPVPSTPLVTAAKTNEQLNPKPIYRKWWFWTAIAVATAGSAIAVGIGVTQSQHDSNTRGLPEFFPFQ